MTAFSALALPESLQRSVAALGFVEMTPIQADSLPALLAGKDVIAQAKTGSGKTVAFGLALLSGLSVEGSAVQALVLCPTRELADQVAKVLRKLASATPNIKILSLCGGMPLRAQLASLVHLPHIVVGTPGRIQEHLTRASFALDALRILVLDEADRMLDMGFEPAISEILQSAPSERQTLLFSATYPEQIRALSKRFQRDPSSVTLPELHDNEVIDQQFYAVELARKPDAVLALLALHKPASTLVFCNTKRDTDALAQTLGARGLSVLALHGDMEQRDRTEVLVRFANGSCSVLVATDVAARGLDLVDLAAVLNYELALDADQHIHRVGRSGRAGQKGLAWSLVTTNELERAHLIEARQAAPLRWSELDLSAQSGEKLPTAAYLTLMVEGGRKDKLRPGDLLGALTGAAGLPVEAVGKIDIFETRAYVALTRSSAEQALARLRAGQIKGKRFRVSKLR